MTPLDKLIASIDRELVKQLRQQPDGCEPMEVVAQRQGWASPDDFSVSVDLEKKLVGRFNRSLDEHWKSKQGTDKAYPAWNAEEKAFAATVACAYFETFQVAKKMYEAIVPQMNKIAKRDPDQLRVTNEYKAMEAFNQTITSGISHHVQDCMVNSGIAGKHYSPEAANAMLGIIARGAINSYYSVCGIIAEIDPPATGRSMFERVKSVQVAPIPQSARMMALLDQLNAMEKGKARA